MNCLIFSNADPMKPCGAPAERGIGIAIGATGKMKTTADAILMGYVPICLHHSEYVPSGANVVRFVEGESS